MPLLPSTDNHTVFVYIKINSHKALPFALDTGTSAALLVDDWASEELGIKKAADATVVEPGHQKFFSSDVQSAEIVTADTGQPLISTNIQSALCGEIGYSAKLTNGERCAGILGMPFLENGVFTFDFSSARLTFYPDGNPPSPERTSVTLPLVQPDTELSHYFVRLETDGKPCDYLLDTGSLNSNLPTPLRTDFLKAYRQTASFLTLRSDSTQTLLTDSILVKDFRLQTMEVPFAYFNVTNASPSCPILGMDLLTHFTTTINVKAKTLTLTPRNMITGGISWEQKGSGQEFLNRAVGFALPSQRGKRLVSNLIKGSPADRGGVQEDDRIVAINGKALSEDDFLVDYKDAASTTTARTDSVMRLTLLRGSKRLTKQFAISNDMDRTTYLPLGVRFLPLVKGRPLLVSAVLGGSAADKAGLKAGDLLEGINGVMFRTESWAAVQSLLAPIPGKRLVLEIGQRQEAEFPKMRWVKARLVINK